MVRKRKEVPLKDSSASSDGEEDSSISGMFDVSEDEVTAAPHVPRELEPLLAPPPSSKQPFSFSFFIMEYQVYYRLIYFMYSKYFVQNLSQFCFLFFSIALLEITLRGIFSRRSLIFVYMSIQ